MDTKQAYIDILNGAIEQYPIVRMGDALGTLHAAKKEMDEVKKDGYDNYAHRLGMCLNAQKGLDSAVFSAALGLVKEAKDIYSKTHWNSLNGSPKKVLFDFIPSLYTALLDSYKDTKNNIEGLSYGLTNPDESCRIWLRDLDYGENKWRR